MIRVARPAVVSVRATGAMAQESATGFIVRDRSGSDIVVTNHHVIWGADEIYIVTTAGAVHRADILGSDPATDLAVLRSRSRLEAGHLTFGDDQRVDIGDWVVAIGNPGGVSEAVSVGVVSARGKIPHPTVAAQALVDYLFTDTAVSAGSSGGPVLTLDGRVLGVNVASAGQSGGLAIVIPARLADQVVTGLARDGAYHHSSTGIRVVDAGGAAVGRVSSCEQECRRSELEAGDQIITIDGERLHTGRELEWREFMTKPGTRWKIEFVRQGKQLSTSVELHEITQESFVERSRHPTPNSSR
jgi:serine protease Do